MKCESEEAVKDSERMETLMSLQLQLTQCLMTGNCETPGLSVLLLHHFCHTKYFYP